MANKPNKRATITVSGDVQDAGFRGRFMRIGQKSGLFGYIENIPDGTVRIICEGEEKVIQEFVKLLDFHDEYIDVEWSDAIGEFKWFTVKITDPNMEMFQGYATAERMLSGVRSDIREMHTDLTEGIQSGFADLKEDTSKTHEKLDGIGTNLGNVIEKYDSFGEKMTKLEHDIGELTYQIKRLVDHVVGEETKSS